MSGLENHCSSFCAYTHSTIFSKIEFSSSKLSFYAYWFLGWDCFGLRSWQCIPSVCEIEVGCDKCVRDWL